MSLTPRAADQVKRIRDKEGLAPGCGLRVSVVGGGCSGFSYQIDFADERQATDLAYECHGISVFVDETSAQYLQGTQIDYVTSLTGGGFKFLNPKATHTCGCGSSFGLSADRLPW